jgi:hypothetical protein
MLFPFNGHMCLTCFIRHLSYEVRGPMLISVKPAVCFCVYLNSREEITPGRAPFGSNWSNWLKACLVYIYIFHIHVYLNQCSPLCLLLIILSVLLRIMASSYLFGIFKLFLSYTPRNKPEPNSKLDFNRHRHWLHCSLHVVYRVGLKPILPIAPNWAPRWSYILSAVQVHTTTHRRFNREQLGPLQSDLIVYIK